MATHMVKVMYEGTVSKALKNAEAGLTSGGAVIYEVMDVPASVTFEDVAAAIRAVKNQPKHKDHEVKWADLAAGLAA
jgi:phosphohistidine swiveling domain-containing protein